MAAWAAKLSSIGRGGLRVGLLLAAAVVTVVSALVVPGVTLSPLNEGMLAVGVVGALVAIRWPVVGQVMIFGAFIGAALITDGHAELLYWLMAAGLVDAAVTSPRWLAPTAAGLLAMSIAAATMYRQGSIYESVASTVLIFGFLLVGLGLRNTLARQEALRQQVEVARLQENQRIAARMHDGLALTLSQTLMKLRLLQAEQEFDPAQVDDLRALTRDAETAMQQLREATQVLSGSHKPVQGALSEQVERMAEGIRGTGFDLRVEIDPDVDDARSDVQETVYLVCRESLANVVRHADRSAPVHLTVRPQGRDWLVAASNAISSDPDRFPSSGHGLSLLQERLATTGSTVEAGADGAQWTLTATVSGRGSSDGNRDGWRRALRGRR